LKRNVQALKNKCDTLERTIQDLQSRFNMHESALEGYRMQVVGILNVHGALDTSYEGEKFDLIQ
jgi:uncharacterized protein YlxP (DUF503 family)